LLDSRLPDSTERSSKRVIGRIAGFIRKLAPTPPHAAKSEIDIATLIAVGVPGRSGRPAIADE
jgi:hypothetical protein